MLLTLLRSPVSTGYAWKYWNGAAESPLTLEGEWDGASVVALSSTITVT